jgi:transcriptional regulator with XRE-family HTH domain
MSRSLSRSSSRSVRIRPECLQQVRTTVRRRGYISQRILAEDLGISQSTVSNFLNGKPVDYSFFVEICQKLEIDWIAIADLEPPEEEAISPNETTNENPTSPIPPPDVETRLIESLPNAGSVKNPGSVSTGYSLKYPEGEVEIDSPLYIDRPPVEQRCYKEISYPGSLIRIKAPRQMGKSSLMTRILYQAEIQGDVTACVNLQGINGERLSDSNKFLQWFCFYVGRLLKIPDKLNDYWNEDLVEMMGGNLCCMAYFEEYLLPTINKPLTLALDEVDKVFEYQQTCRDFFGLLRMLHEEGKRRDMMHMKLLKLYLNF